MKKKKNILLLFFFTMFFYPGLFAQNDPEFSKGFIIHMRFHNGVITKFNESPDLYVAGLQVISQYNVIPNLLRAGAVAGTYYTGKKIQAMAGPALSLKLMTIHAEPFGSAANIHLSMEHLWGSQQQRLLGGGLYLDLLNKLVIGISTHRDYALNTWWIQNAVALRISKLKKTDEPFNQ